MRNRILPLRRSGNLLLCTLLLGNVSVNAMLSILMADLTSGLIGFFASTVLIVIFGEITPQSICARHGLMIGAYTVWIVRIFIILLYIVAKPIAFVLDCILGQELGNILSRNQMKKLFEMYEKDQLLHPNERKLLTAALEIQNKKAKTIMTPINKIYMLDINTKLTEEKIHEIYLQGFSKVPIYEDKRENIVGILLVRDLLVINNRKEIVILKQLGSLIIKDIIAVDIDSHLESILKEFKKEAKKICIVRKIVDDGIHDPYYQNQGIISLEDIIKELFQDNIEDEIDQEKEQARKGDGMTKQKLLNLFSEKRGTKVLSSQERNAICSYLAKYEEPFKENRISRKSLEKLVDNSEVVTIDSLEKDQISSMAFEEDEEFKKKRCYSYHTNNDKTTNDSNEVNIFKNKNPKSGVDAAKSFALKPDDINLKFNPKLKSKADIGKKEFSIPEATQEYDYFDRSDTLHKMYDINTTNKGIHKKEFSDESDLENLDYVYEIDTKSINPVLYSRNTPADYYYLVLTGKVQILNEGEGIVKVFIF